MVSACDVRKLIDIIAGSRDKKQNEFPPFAKSAKGGGATSVGKDGPTRQRRDGESMTCEPRQRGCYGVTSYRIGVVRQIPASASSER